MSTIRLALLMIIIAYQAVAAVEAQNGWVNALKPKGAAGPELSLALGGRASYTILLPENPTTQDEKAAADLAMWLREMTGAKFRIVQERACLPVGPVISVGRTKLLEQSDIWMAQSDLGNEGYAIAVRNRNLFLFGGKKRGPINAVYALLEEDLGCRWYDRHSATIPRVRNLKFRPVQRKYTPVLEIRDPFYHTAFNTDWSLRNRTNSPSASIPEEWGGHIDYALFVHTYNELMPPKEFFKDHPEYYSELKGERKPQQLCLTNLDVLRIMVERVKERLAKKPHSEIISVSPNDWTDYCECANCRAIDEAEGSHSGTLIKFVNAVAEAIEEDYPNVKVSTLAYLGTFKPPLNIKPRHNVAIQLCTDSHAWPHPFLLVTETTKFQQAMKGWNAMGATMHIWDYTVNFSHHMAPMPNMPVVSPNIRWYIRHGAKGVMLQGWYECGGTENVQMRTWVWAKQLWDPTLDTRELMRDFIFGYFKEAAEPIWEYNIMLWRIWEENRAKPKSEDILYNAGIRYSPTSRFLDDEFVSRASAFMDKAERLAKDPETQYRVKVAKLPILYVKLSDGLGYPRDWSDEYKPGRMTRDQVGEYKKMLEEFEELAQSEKITGFLEMARDGEKRINRWKEKLAAIEAGKDASE